VIDAGRSPRSFSFCAFDARDAHLARTGKSSRCASIAMGLRSTSRVFVYGGGTPNDRATSRASGLTRVATTRSTHSDRAVGDRMVRSTLVVLAGGSLVMKKILASISTLAFAFCLAAGAGAAPAPSTIDAAPVSTPAVAPDAHHTVTPNACGRACYLAGGSCLGKWCV
jgi:hypothetical protein